MAKAQSSDNEKAKKLEKAAEKRLSNNRGGKAKTPSGAPSGSGSGAKGGVSAGAGPRASSGPPSGKQTGQSAPANAGALDEAIKFLLARVPAAAQAANAAEEAGMPMNLKDLEAIAAADPVGRAALAEMANFQAGPSTARTGSRDPRFPC